MQSGGENIFQREILGYITLTGDLRRLKGDLAGAETAYRDAISLDPLIPTTHISLAIALAAQGKLAEARATADKGLALLAPDERERNRRTFEEFLKHAAAASPAQGAPSR